MADHAVEHDYHLVDPSPWPLVSSLGIGIFAIGLVIFFKGLGVTADDGAINFLIGKGSWIVTAAGAGIFIWSLIGWWLDVIKESRQGDHTPIVQIGLRYGMIMFIMQEVMFFVAWFWMFFELALFPEARGWSAPNEGLHTIDPWHIPLMNTLILLLSGTTVTWAHHALLHGNRKEAKIGLGLTILLGIAFTALQVYEYQHIDWTPMTNAYGSIFFFATGFHGFHVLLGTVFLIVCFLRLMAGQFTPEKHFGFEAAAWYWHFVDVVWLFLFTFVYVVYQ